MSTTTSNFGLFKYDVVEDAQSAFNIQQALNYNWDIIDENLGSSTIATYETPGIVKPDGTSIYIDENGLLSMGNHGFITSSYHSGASWYRQYSDGFKMAGGQVATAASDVNWAQPYLTDNGTMGGNSFACEGSTHAYSYYAWRAFDGNEGNTNCFETAQGAASYLTFYNPIPIKVTQLRFRIGSNSGSFAYYTPGHVIVYGSDTNGNWTQLKDYTNTTYTQNSYWYLSMSDNTSYYKYYRLSLLTRAATTGRDEYRCIPELSITATYLGSGGTGITFPISFSDTNYSCMLGFQGGSGSSTYISSKTTTGMTLSSTPSATCYWIAMGW